jgi:hypothetical protein
MWFSQQYPQHRGLLFEVNNDSYSAKHGTNRTAMGRVKGVSDLMLIEPIAATTIGIELKAPESRHDKNHIETQLNWGKKIIESGGFYFMLSELDTLKMVATWIMENTHTEELMELMRNNIKEVEKKLRSGAKTVSF